MIDLTVYEKIATDLARNNSRYAGHLVDEEHPSYPDSREYIVKHIVALATNQNALEALLVALEGKK